MLWTWISSPMPRSRPSAKLASWSLRRKCNVLKVGGRDNTCIYTPCYEYRFRIIRVLTRESLVTQKKWDLERDNFHKHLDMMPSKTSKPIGYGDRSQWWRLQRWPFQWCFGMFLQGFLTNNNRYYWVNLHCYWGGSTFEVFFGFIPLISVPVSSPWKDWSLYPYFCCLNLHP